MKKMSKTEEKKLQLLELATRYLQQVTDKKLKMALSALIKKGTTNLKALKIKEIETVLEMVNDDAVFEEKEVKKTSEKTPAKKVDKKEVKTTSKKTAKKLEKTPKEVEKVEPDYREIFKDEISYSELEKNNVFKKQDLTFDGIKELHRSGDDEVFLISHWSPFDLKNFNYSGTREVPEELCRQFENDLDILRVVHVEQYKDVLFTESVLTSATFTFLACDFQKTEKGCRFSEGLPFEVYKIVEQPRHRKRASKK